VFEWSEDSLRVRQFDGIRALGVDVSNWDPSAAS
jgi:hypothetical protein